MTGGIGVVTNTRFNTRVQKYLPREIQMARLKAVIRLELTELQRYTVMAYYFQGQTLEQIARDRHVNRSTVCRTLHRAEKKLRRFLDY